MRASRRQFAMFVATAALFLAACDSSNSTGPDYNVQPAGKMAASDTTAPVVVIADDTPAGEVRMDGSGRLYVGVKVLDAGDIKIRHANPCTLRVRCADGSLAASPRGLSPVSDETDTLWFWGYWDACPPNTANSPQTVNLTVSVVDMAENVGTASRLLVQPVYEPPPQPALQSQAVLASYTEPESAAKTISNPVAATCETCNADELPITIGTGGGSGSDGTTTTVVPGEQERVTDVDEESMCFPHLSHAIPVSDGEEAYLICERIHGSGIPARCSEWLVFGVSYRVGNLEKVVVDIRGTDWRLFRMEYRSPEGGMDLVSNRVRTDGSVSRVTFVFHYTGTPVQDAFMSSQPGINRLYGVRSADSPIVPETCGSAEADIGQEPLPGRVAIWSEFDWLLPILWGSASSEPVLWIGQHPAATDGLDADLQTPSGLSFEEEMPPPPPAGVPDIALIVAGGRQMPDIRGTDSVVMEFVISFVLGDPPRPAEFSWDTSQLPQDATGEVAFIFRAEDGTEILHQRYADIWDGEVVIPENSFAMTAGMVMFIIHRHN